jgi:hypothetical protein
MYENSLLLVPVLLVVLTLGGQIVTGWRVHNDDLAAMHVAPLSLASYLTSGHLLEATFENWESEFLQMGLYVVLSIWLRQRGSSESKQLYETEDTDREPDPTRKGAPWPVRRGGVALWLYRRSLAIAFLALFLASAWLHAVGGADVYSLEQVTQGKPPVSTIEYLGTSQFWFESLQNWQSEMVSIVAIVGLSIFLRQQGSPQSKPVDAPISETDD